MTDCGSDNERNSNLFRSVSDMSASHYACFDHVEANMREKDDEILERGVEGTCSGPSTPVLGPLDAAEGSESIGRTSSGHRLLESVDELSMLSGQVASEVIEIEAVLPRSVRGSASGCQRLDFGRTGSGIRTCGTDNNTGSERRETERTPSEAECIDALRDSILNESICTVDSVEINDQNRDIRDVSQTLTCSFDLPPPGEPSTDKLSSSACDVERLRSPSAAAAAVPEDDTDNETEQTSYSGREIIVYYSPTVSKSIDRRMNEAAQFAEAIGEVPPTDASVLPEIIEEDSSSSEYDEDQGATEVDGISILDDLDCDLSRDMRPLSSTRSLSAHSQNLPPMSPLRQGKEKVSFAIPSPAQPAIKLPTSPLAQDEVPSMVIMKSPCNVPAPPITQPQHDDATPRHNLSHEQQINAKSMADEAAGPDCSAEKPKMMKRRLFISKPLSMTRSLSKSTESLLNRISHEEGTDKSESTYVYKGIRHNPPEVTKRGISRGNYAQLHRKAWLEVSDKYHRYGKNLRLYYKHWEKLGHPTNMFFDWIDSKGEAAGAPLPNLPECPRSQLDSDTVLYITNPEIQERYALTVDLDEDSVARILDVNGDPISTGTEGWIFVLRDHVLYGSQKVTSITGKSKQRFHHSSFFGGKAVAAAGIIITDEDGCLTRLYPHSGHYRPGEAHMQRMLYFLQQSGVDLNTFEVDMQQILHVARKEATPKGGVLDEKDKAKLQQDGKDEKDGACHTKKSKKVESLKLHRGFDVACFLAHKALMIEENVFSHVHKIRKLGPVSVKEVLDAIDDGGYWHKLRLELCEH